ncbi:alpha/beta fold hydrolase [Marinivivus vitaminiproducens]|uniref:alpha/beta fold hydrolase n=1 Tax=Marinivivus vitaminiproducens TaxID=3035935 RepID=UPI0027A71F1F|nr:alpha/beta hydrolase [Geminicoccaceae bacterium SCSIO 64248]
MTGAGRDIRDVEIAGHRLRVHVVGTPALGQPVVVLLHEGLGSISMWRAFPDVLSQTLRLPVLVYDRYGHGESDPLSGPRAPGFLDHEAVDVLPALLAACGVTRPILLGHSDGGTIALMYAAAFPERPLACITEAAHVLSEAKTREGVASVMRRWRDDADFRRRLSRHHGDGTAAMIEAWGEVWLRPEHEAWSMLDRLPAIRCPVLAIQGWDDEHGTRAQTDAIARGVGGPVEIAMIEDCAHVPHHQAPKTVLDRVRTFLAPVLPGVVADG